MPHDTQQRSAGQPHPQRQVRRGLSVAAVAAVGFAGLVGLSWIIHSSETVAIAERVTRVEIDVSSGQVEIVASPSGEAALDFEVKSGWIRDGGVSYEVDGTTLRVSGGCDSGVFLGLWCQSDVTVTVPADADVVAHAAAGSITASGLSGETTLESSAGDVVVADQNGPLTAHSAAGSVRVDGLDADTAKVTSSAGPVSLQAERAPRSLDAESSAGDVTVVLPDDVSYDVETDSSVGAATVDVPTLPGSVFEVRAFSSAGRVSVTSD